MSAVMDASRQRVLALAEAGDWDDALALVAADAALAKAQDDFGMLPLHWACTEPGVALAVVRALVDAFPGACRLENLSGMLPLHVAIRNKLPGLHVNALLDVYPEAAFTKDGRGRYPIDLAMESNLPKYTIDLIRKAGARAVRSSASGLPLVRAASFDDAASVYSSDNQSLVDDVASSDGSELGRGLLKAPSLDSLRSTRRAAAYSHLLDESLPPTVSSSASSSSDAIPMLHASASTSSLRGTVMDSTTISLQLRELLGQLQQLSVDLRTSTSTSGSTYRSSFSSTASSSIGAMLSGSHAGLISVLWNPSDKFGFVMEPADGKSTGARIKQFASRSDVLGVEALGVGDVLMNINGASVVGTSFTSIMRFLKHSKVTCKLRFAHGPRAATPELPGKWHSGPNPASEHDEAMYSKVTAMLDATLQKVAAVEETVRLSSAMSFCS